MKYKILNLGCPKNLVDGEILAGVLSSDSSHISIPDGSLIINTCSFIASARAEAISEIRNAVSMKRRGEISKVYVTGCMVKSHIDEIKSIDGIDGIIEPVFTWERLFERAELFHNRILASNPRTAYVRIADGCNKRCSYCLIPTIRGQYRSRKMDDIIDEVNGLSKRDVNEIVLISEDVGSYGSDIYGEFALPRLLTNIDKISEIKWIRLLYLNPQSLTNELLEVMKSSDKVLHYFDIPLQHTSSKILTAMGRSPLSMPYSKWLSNIYDILPDAVIRITFMVGFPSETEDEFYSLLMDIELNPPDHLTVFIYSKERNTIAGEMPSQINDEIKLERYNKLLGLYYRLGIEKKRQRFVGKIEEVILEDIDVNLPYSLGIGSIGRLWFQAPDIDGKIFLPDYKIGKVGEIINVLVDGVRGYDFIGSVII